MQPLSHLLTQTGSPFRERARPLSDVGADEASHHRKTPQNPDWGEPRQEDRRTVCRI